MTALELRSVMGTVSDSAQQMLDAKLREHEAVWILKTALIIGALERTKGNKTRAARMLGIHRNLLEYQIRELALKPFLSELKKSAKRQLGLFRNSSKRQRPTRKTSAIAQIWGWAA